MEKYQEIERSIIKTYRAEIWRPFITAVAEYRLINENDAVAACISGGKDSMLMAKCLQELQRHGGVPFRLEFIVMDPGYNPENRKLLEENAKLLDIPIQIFDTKIFDVVANMDGNPCYICARMRRGYLYNFARELGCNKIALAHHFDDTIETILMSMLYAGQIKTMMPKLHSTNHPGMELIRPMCLVKEAAVLRWKKHHDLKFLQCACRFTEYCSADSASTSKRQEMKALVKRFREISPVIDMNIFNSVQNINLETVLGYHDRNGTRSFLDDYDQ